MDILEARLLLTSDFGDAPDTTLVSGVNNYDTLAANGGPSHVIDATMTTLYMGAGVDGEAGLFQNANAGLDDQVAVGGRDDEDGVLSPLDLNGTSGAAPTVTVLATNTTGRVATLSGWIDFNRDGVFDNASERAQISVPNASSKGRFTLTFPAIPAGSGGNTYARFRLSTDVASANPTGAATDGEVEDHKFVIQKPSKFPAEFVRPVIIAKDVNGGPNVDPNDYFGYASTAIGDLNRDGITDLVVGAPFDSTDGREYPVEQTFSPQGRMSTLKTWQDFSGNSGTATTTWNYDSQRGWLDNKRYADNIGPDYDYTPAGRLRQRTWARTDTTAYLTNAVGEVERITYSDVNTGNVTNTYDRRGRVTTVQSGTNVTTRLYSEAGLLLSETLNGVLVTNQYDALLRRTSVGVVVGGSLVASTSYGYDSAGRLSTVGDGTNVATYSYVANSPLIAQLLFQQHSTMRMTTSKSYDYLNRLLLITNHVTASGAEKPSFAYALNAANQRTAITNEHAAHWLYGYDALGQVTNGTRRWSDGSPVLGQQFAYLFYDIGNRKSAISGGDGNGNHLRLHTYSPNALNQYTSRTVPGWLDVIGTASNAATVTVNHRPTSRKADYYRAEVSVPNSGAVWQSITNVAVLASGTNDYVTNWTGNVFVPQTPESFTHDLDGNLTSDGRWTNRWDGENRLISQTSHASGPSGSRYDLRHGYDSQSRRISKVVSNWTGSAWAKLYEQRFVYDGWNLLAILDENNAVQVSFDWGTDLSGTMQGAGGVGGLISMTVHGGAWAGTYFYAFDGNGNVAALVSAYDGTVVARYEYDPFHRLLRATGPLAQSNPFVASTKFCDGETGLLYYGYRFYDPNTGRWWNRDPIFERGDRNIHAFARNCPTSAFDPDGRLTITLPWWTPHGAAAVIGGAIGTCINRTYCRRSIELRFAQAEQEAHANAPDETLHRPTNDPNRVAVAGGDADALTHCIASCEVAKSPSFICGGLDRHLDLLQSREVGNAPETVLDRLNNEAGFALGMEKPESCLDGCLDYLRRGLLNEIRNGVTVPSSVE